MLATIDYLPDFYLQDGLVLFGDGILVSLEPIVVLYPEMQIVNQLLMIFLIIFGAALIGYSLLLSISAIWVMRSNKGLKKAKVIWLVIGILLLSNQIFQLAYYNIIFSSPIINRLGHFSHQLTVSFTIDIGMILLIFGSVVLILGYILAKRASRNLFSDKSNKSDLV